MAGNKTILQLDNGTLTPFNTSYIMVHNNGTTNAGKVPIQTLINAVGSNVSVTIGANTPTTFTGFLVGNGSFVLSRNINGTVSQVIVANGNGVAGDVTLSLPQDINTTSTPTFANVKHSNILNATWTGTDGNGSLTNQTVPTGIVAGNGTAIAGRTILGTTSQIIVANGTGVAGNINLSLPQDINTTSSPSFANVSVSSIISAALLGTSSNGSLVNQTVSGVVIGNGTTLVGRSVVGTTNQITVTNGTGTAGDITIGISANYTLSNISITNAAFVGTNGTGVFTNGTVPTGLVAGNGTVFQAGRTITGTVSQVIVSNGDGVSGNPTLSLPQDINTTSSPSFANVSVSSIISAAIIGTSSNGSLVNQTVSGIVIGNGTTLVGRSIIGTTNQITVANGTGTAGNINLSLPQNISTTSSPTFSNVTIGITNATLIGTNTSGAFINGTVPTGLVAGNGTVFTAGRTITGTLSQVIVSNGNGVSGDPTLSLPQSINTTSSPSFANISVSTIISAGILGTSSNGSLVNQTVAGVVIGNGTTLVGRTILGTTNQITVANGTGTAGNINLSLPQNIGVTAYPSFANVALSSLINAPLATYSSNGSPQILTLDPGNVTISGGVLYARGSPRPILALTNTSYTLATAHENYFITCQNSSLCNITIPTNANASINITTEYEIFNLGTGNVTVVIQSGAITLYTFNSTVTLVANTSLGLKKIGTNAWVMSGYTQ